MEKVLGKIASVRFGHVGYQDCQLGIFLDFDLNGRGVSKNICYWDANLIKHGEGCKWSEEDRDAAYADIMRKLSDLLYEAKVDSVDKLKGIPVEVTIDSMIFKDFRILTEVL